MGARNRRRRSGHRSPRMNFAAPGQSLKEEAHYHPMRLIETLTAIALALGASIACASDPASDVRQLEREREQQQLDLRLKMQQQQERALHPSLTPSADLARRQIERDQQQRQRQLHDQQSRAGIAERAAPNEAERERAAQSAAEQLRRFESERQAESERAAGRDRQER